MSDHEQTLRALAADLAKNGWTPQDKLESAACLAGADALVRDARTCGNCRHFWPWDRTAMAGTGDCHHHKFRGRMNGLADTFGCKAWATREAE